MDVSEDGEFTLTLTPEEVLKVLQAQMQTVVGDAVATMRERNPGISPIAAVSEIMSWIGSHMMTFAPHPAVRLGMLMAYEGAHPEPMNFMDINKAKTDLVRIASTRKAVEQKIEAAKAGIALPNQEDQGQ